MGLGSYGNGNAMAGDQQWTYFLEGDAREPCTGGS
jgi:hypothetical protein